MIQEVVFKLNEEDYGLDIMNVNEIIRMQEITAMPNTSAYVLGVTNIRGKVIPVLSLKNLFHLENTEDDENVRIIVAAFGEKLFGLKVDSVSEIVKIEEDDIERQEFAGDQGSKYISGIAKLERGLVKLLDLEKMFQ